MEFFWLLVLGAICFFELALLVAFVEWVEEGKRQMSERRIVEMMKARYAGVCRCGCDAEILPGMPIAWFGKGEVYHWAHRPQAQEEQRAKRGQ